jgi:hypothetical protein
VVTADFLNAIFRLPGRVAGPPTAQRGGLCQGTLGDAVEHVVDQLSSRLRAVPNYARSLKEPLATTFRHIDQVAEAIPGTLHCSPTVFGEDPRINAFFVSPQHIREVFSQSDEVRSLFDADPGTQDCWALLCMAKKERRQPGMALINGEVRRDVMVTTVSFGDHQVVSPGSDEPSARCALKCCMFNSVLAHIRRTITQARTETEDRENRLRLLKGRLRRAEGATEAARLGTEVQALEEQLGAQPLRIQTIQDQLAFVAQALASPAQYLDAGECKLRLSRLGVKLEAESPEPGYDLGVCEIRVASHRPRIGALVRFPRAELLPRPDFLRQAEIFLAL